MSISEATILKAPCPTCGAILNIPSDYPSSVAACPLCGAAVAVPRSVVLPLKIAESSSPLGPVRTRVKRGNKAEIWAIGGGAIAISAAVIAYAIQVATAPPAAEEPAKAESASKVARGPEEPPPPSLRAGGEAILDGRGKDKIYLASEGAWDDLVNADSAGIAHLIARGRVLCEANGGRVSLVSERDGRWKVKVVEGVNAGGEGWVKAEDLRAPARAVPTLPRLPRRSPNVASVRQNQPVREIEEPARPPVDPAAGFENNGAFDNPNPAMRGGRGGSFDNPVSGRPSNFETPPSAPRSRMAPRPSGPNQPDPSFGPGGENTPGPAPAGDSPATPDPNAIPPRTPPGGTPR